MSGTKRILDCTRDVCRSHHRAGSLTNDFSIASDFTSGCFGACTTKRTCSNATIRLHVAQQYVEGHEPAPRVADLYAMLGPFTCIVVFYSACLSPAWKVGEECACGARVTKRQQDVCHLRGEPLKHLGTSYFVPDSAEFKNHRVAGMEVQAYIRDLQ